MSEQLVGALAELIHSLYPGEQPVPLHRPTLDKTDEAAVAACVASTFVSSAGPEIQAFEDAIAGFCGSPYAIATVNGTAALHLALHCCGVKPGDLVLTQSLTFAATGHAILQAGASPVYIDISLPDAGMCPEALAQFLETECTQGYDGLIHKDSGRRISACIPMHSFGTPVQIERLTALCQQWQLPLIEDAAEALGSTVSGRHCGTFGLCGVLSFNGNKIMTTGAGGMVLTADPAMARKLKHVSTTAKVPDEFEFFHDEPGFNYRLPNLNASLGLSQFQKLPGFIRAKQSIASAYQTFFSDLGYPLISNQQSHSNHWLNTVLLKDADEKQAVLQGLKAHGIMARPVWTPLHRLPHLRSPLSADLPVTDEVYARAISLPSSAQTQRISDDSDVKKSATGAAE